MHGVYFQCCMRHCCPAIFACQLQKRILLLCAGDIAGLDIGCGASLIYPLLGAPLHGWRFVAVDVTDVALCGARNNLALNSHLAPLIEVSVLFKFCRHWAPARQHSVLQQPASLATCGCAVDHRCETHGAVLQQGAEQSLFWQLTSPAAQHFLPAL